MLIFGTSLFAFDPSFDLGNVYEIDEAADALSIPREYQTLPLISPSSVHEDHAKIKTTVMVAAVASAAPSHAQSKQQPRPKRTIRAPEKRADFNPKAQKQKKRKKRAEHFCNHRGCPKFNHNWDTKYKLERHQLIHSGKKPFQCTICGIRLNQLSSITTHLQSSTHRETVKKAIQKELQLGEDADVSKYLLDRKFLKKFILDTRKQK